MSNVRVGIPVTGTYLLPTVGGSDAASGSLTLISTTDAVKGKINLGASTNSYFDEAMGSLVVVNVAQAAGTPVGFSFTGAAHTNMANAEFTGFNVNMAQTKTFSGGGGAIATERAAIFQAPTYAASAAQTVSDAATLAVTGAPATSGVNITVTRTWALWVQAGATRIQGKGGALGTGGLSIGATGTPTAMPAYDVDVLYSGTGVGDGNTPTVAVRNSATAILSYASFLAISNNGAVDGAFVSDGLGTGIAATAGVTVGSRSIHPLGIATGNVVRMTLAGDGRTNTWTQAAAATGSPVGWTYTGGAHLTLTSSVEASSVKYDLSQTVQFSGGALATQRAFVILAPTYAFSGASTLTTAATFAVSGAPIQGAGATLTNSYAIWVQSGTSQFDGAVGSTLDDATNNAVTNVLTLTHTANTGAGANNIGTGILFNSETTTSTVVNIGAMQFQMTDAVAATGKSKLIVQNRLNAALTTNMTLDQTGFMTLTGTAPIIQCGGVTAAGSMVNGYATTAGAGAISSAADFYINIDSDNTGTTSKLTVAKNATAAGGTAIWSVDEAGTHTYADASSLVGGTSTGTTFMTGSTQKVGWWGSSPVARISMVTLTNNVTSGGTTDVIDNWTDLTTYATDAAAIRNAVYQLARKVKEFVDNERTYGRYG